MTNQNSFIPIVRDFFEHDMPAAVHSLERMIERDAVEVLESLPPSLAARIIKHLQISFAASLLKDSDDVFLRETLSLLEPHFAASILMHVPQDVRERMTEHISGELKRQIREVLEYPEGSVGRIMTTDFLKFDKDVIVEEATQEIRSLAKKQFPQSYAYVVDGDNCLIGVLNMRDLLLASPDKSLESIARKDIFSLHCFIDKQEAANELAKRKFFAAPVVDSENHILGIIKAERLIQGIQEDLTKDIQKIFGAGGDERVYSTILFSLKKRLGFYNTAH